MKPQIMWAVVCDGELCQNILIPTKHHAQYWVDLLNMSDTKSTYKPVKVRVEEVTDGK